MNSSPRIFVVTLFCGEGDFETSSKVIHEQQGVEVTHHIIEGMNEKDAHNSMFAAWREARSSHDLFVKVDADTVLVSKTTLSSIWEQFQKNPRVTGMQAPLMDYMTDGLINGLNVCSSRVLFEDTKDELYCDRVKEVGQDIVLRQANLPAELVPAGFHCKYANEKQAFHFGLHRQLKNQTEVIQKVKAAWAQNHDRVRAFALIGAKMSSRFASMKRFNYSDKEFVEAFEEATVDYDHLVRELGA